MNRRGFSLIELLIVVAIIALLSAIILPGLARAREYAYFARCKSNMRQIGIGFLCYAGNNTGRLPNWNNDCAGTNDCYGGRKIGGLNGGHWMRGYRIVSQKYLIDKIYADWQVTGYDWYGDARNQWKIVGKPREKGKYLTIDVLWDPICKVKNWGPFGRGGFEIWYDMASWGHQWVMYAGSERDRDQLTRKNGVMGYYWFVGATGCETYRKDPSKTHHLLEDWELNGNSASEQTAEGPNCRPATKQRNITTVARPSAWVNACHTAVQGTIDVQGEIVPRSYTSHFGVRRTYIGDYRFNVLHLDGHVHDDVWKQVSVENSWLIYEPDLGWGQKSHAYGWMREGDGSAGLKEMPEWNGAFDQNKNEMRRESRIP
jgi:prepilin-type N-terminal cleavage/methylation domain-containing protein/prepilin-type processing-associated H-X9-DG protein